MNAVMTVWNLLLLMTHVQMNWGHHETVNTVTIDCLLYIQDYKTGASV